MPPASVLYVESHESVGYECQCTCPRMFGNNVAPVGILAHLPRRLGTAELEKYALRVAIKQVPADSQYLVRGSHPFLTYCDWTLSERNSDVNKQSACCFAFELSLFLCI